MWKVEEPMHDDLLETQRFRTQCGTCAKRLWNTQRSQVSKRARERSLR